MTFPPFSLQNHACMTELGFSRATPVFLYHDVNRTLQKRYPGCDALLRAAIRLCDDIERIGMFGEKAFLHFKMKESHLFEASTI